jgi:hypothetical protein
VNDEGKPQDDPVQPDERARELTEQLNLLEALDRRITSEHVAQRFHELLRSDGPSAPGTAHSAGSSRPAESTYRRRVSRFLLTLAGADPEIADRTPDERVRLEGPGWAILITSGVAAVSMWFALATVMGVSGFVAVPAALVWGLVIMGIDRWLVASMPVDSTRRKLAVAAPRFLLAVLLGAVISTPLVLRIFQPEINAQINVMRAQQLSEPRSQVSQWQDQVSNLERVIDSGGQVPINPSTDPTTVALIKQLNAERVIEQTAYRGWQCQLYGGPGCPVGNGPLAKASQTAYEQAAAEVSSLQSQIQSRESQLAATGGQAANARLRQAQDALPAARAELAAARAQLNAVLASLQLQDGNNDLLTRLQALNQLAGGNPTVSAARWLLFLLFVLIECLPVTVKLVQPAVDYQKILARELDRRLKITLIQEGLRQRSADPQQGRRPPVLAPHDATPAQAASSRRTGPLAVPDDLKKEIEGIRPFMDDTSETAPEHAEELENLFFDISQATNKLLSRGYSKDQINKALREAAEMTNRYLEEVTQTALTSAK